MENSPLGKLPPEIRNNIYELILTAPTDLCFVFGAGGVHKCTLSRPANPTIGSDQPSCNPISNALVPTRVCKQMRAETLDLFFELNDVRITSADAVKFPLANSLHALPDCVKPTASTAIRRLTFDVGESRLPRVLFPDLDHFLFDPHALFLPLRKIALELGWSASIETRCSVFIRRLDNLDERRLFVRALIPVRIPICGTATDVRIAKDNFVKSSEKLCRLASMRKLFERCIAILSGKKDL